MASNSSKALPFVTLIIVVLALGYEAYSGTDVDLEAFLPLLMATGLGGAGLAAVKHAANAKKALPQSIKNQVKTEVDKIFKRD